MNNARTSTAASRAALLSRYDVETLEGRVLLSGSTTDLFISQVDPIGGTCWIGQYTTSGATVKAKLITGLSSPDSLVGTGSDLLTIDMETDDGWVVAYSTAGKMINPAFVEANTPQGIGVGSSGDIFVGDQYTATIGEYTSAGKTIKAEFISYVNQATGIVQSGSDLFVSDNMNGSLTEYTTSGVPVKTLAQGMTDAVGVAVAGSDVFLLVDSGVIEYDAKTGDPIDDTFITGLSQARAITVVGSDIYIASASGEAGIVGEYDLTGKTVNAKLITLPGQPYAICSASTSTTPPPVTTSTVSGTIYDDKNGNGKMDKKEVGLSGVTVTLQGLKKGKASGKALTTTSNKKGGYSFASVSGGSYKLTETLPRGYALSQPSGGSYTFTVTAGVNISGENFGNKPAAKRALAQFSTTPVIFLDLFPGIARAAASGADADLLG